MEKFKLVGYQRVDMVDKQSGNHITGYSLFFLQQIESTQGKGYRFIIGDKKKSSIFLNDSEFARISPAVDQWYEAYTVRVNGVSVIVKDSLAVCK